MRYTLLFILALGLTACKGDKETTTATDTAKTTKTKSSSKSGALSLPDACSLVTDAEMASYIGVNVGEVEVKDGSGANATTSRSCFFKWEDSGVPNAGVMVQVMKNPVQDDVPEYLELYIENKKKSGEKSFQDDKSYKYEDFPGYGDAGAYSYPLHKYTWRIGRDYAFLIAFNANFSKSQEMDIAKKVADKMMANFKK